MRSSIRTRVILSMNLLVVAVGLVVGLAGQRVAGRAIERKLVDESVANVAGLVSRMRLPLSDTLMKQLQQILGAQMAASSADGVILSTSLPAGQVKDLARKLAQRPPPRHVTLAGQTYRVGWAVLSPPGHGEQGAAPNRLYLLMPKSQVEAATREVNRTISILALIAIGAATLIGLWLSTTISRPVKQLADRMDRITAAAAESSALPAAAQQPVPSPHQPGPAELASLAASFDKLLSRLREAQAQLTHSTRLATLGRLSASVVHELRNPLSGIKMNARVLADELARHNLEDESLELIVREIDRMDLYLQELLNLAGPSASPDNIENDAAKRNEPMDLNAITDSVVSLLSSKCKHAGIRIERDYLASPPAVRAVPDQIRQVILNLMLNALDAMPHGGTVSLGTSATDGGDLRFSISDTGNGVDAANGDIFEPFVSSKADGAGLGLHVCRKIIARHQGRIGYDTSPDGSTFWFELPVHEEL